MEAVLEKPIEIQTDPSFSVIVPVYQVPDMVFKRCLMSIYEQNYKNLEVILVFDGEDKKLFKIAEPFLESPYWKAFVVPHGGACAARNYGFKKSIGEIVAFINSDYNLKRGTIRNWVDKLMENKDCGFVYGGYEYTTKQRQVYASKKFDAWELTQANYIDCGFPLWRQYVVEWDPNCKSLQDWDFWLRVIKTHKVKGYYLGDLDFSYFAEPPRPKGLSVDSHSNWVERVKYVKERNGIRINELLVTSLGAPYHGKEIAKMLGADFRDDTIFKPNEYKALYMIGFYLKPGQAGNQHGPILEHYKKGKRIIHWVGADIFWLRKFAYDDLKSLGGALRLSADVHLVENEQAKYELKDLIGVDAQVQPIPPYIEYEKKELPKEFSVGVFITDKSDFDKYMKEETLSIIRSMPETKFNIYGDSEDPPTYPNVKFVGNLSKEKWKEFVYSNSCLLRLVKHDTLPLANTEFMMAGRPVISNIPGECTHLIDTSGDSELNKWDKFSPGFSTLKWPGVKKNVIQAIRRIKKGEMPEFPGFERFNKETYINKIYELANLRRPQ